MTSAAASWTSERIAALAVDLKALERARKLSKPSKGWSGLAADDEGSVLRGTCSGSSGRYEVSVDLRSGDAECSCPSRQQPCKHALGMLLMLLADPSTFGIELGGAVGHDEGDEAASAPAAGDAAPTASADPAQTVELLARAREAARSGDSARALEATLAAWRAVANVAPRAALPLAAAIDRFDAELVQAAGGVEGAKRDEIHERFMALDPAAPEPLAVGQLLPVLTKATNQQATARLKRIASWPHDPRVSRALAALLAEMKVLRSESGKGFWGTALIVLGNTPDLRTLDVVRSLGREHSARYGVSTRDWMRKQVKQLRERLERELLREDPLEPRVAEALEHFAREVGDSSAPHGGGERDAAALLHAIYEAPDDDELRAVYADVLSQIGDARGELITLQLARAGKPKARASKRERELLGEHAEAWLGSLSHYLLRGGLRFERGFVAEARWNRKRDDEVDSTLDDPAWSTVHTLLGPAPAALALAPVMRSLRAVQVDVAGLTGKQRASLADQLRARGVEIISA